MNIRFSQPVNVVTYIYTNWSLFSLHVDTSRLLSPTARPSVSSLLQITNRSFRYASLYLWNQLPSSFRQPHSVHSPPGSPFHLILCASPDHSPNLQSHHLSFSRPFALDSKLISFTNPFLHSLTDSFWTVFAEFGPDLLGHWRLLVLFFFFYIFYFWSRVLD